MQVKSNLEKIVSLDPYDDDDYISHLNVEVHERIREKEQEQTNAEVLTEFLNDLYLKLTDIIVSELDIKNIKMPITFFNLKLSFMMNILLSGVGSKEKEIYDEICCWHGYET